MPNLARTERSAGGAKRVEGRGGWSVIFHRFRVQANFNNIRSIRYSRPHIKSVRANEAPPERRNMMSGGRGAGQREEKRGRVRWHEEEEMARRGEAVKKDRGWKRPKGWAEQGAE